MTIKIANGASARDIAVAQVPLSNVLDWRELRRWNIPESRVPAGSTILFRPQSLFDSYRRYVIGGMAIFTLQLALIVGLLVQRTRRQRAEGEAQRARETLAHVTRVSAMGELAASLAHELYQPLSSILFNARAANRLLESRQDSLAEVKEILQDIADEDQRASDVISRMRELVSKRPTEYLPLDLNDVVNSVTKLVRHDSVVREASLDINLEPDPLMVSGDSVQLQQVILNLLINAFEATALNKSSRRNVAIQTKSDDGETVHAIVRDNGPGLQDGTERQVFEPLYTTKTSGIGMGLAIARSIVESHGGKIWASAGSKGGAEFHFTLPRIQAPR